MTSARPIQVFYSADARERQGEPLPPMVSGHCDWCGAAVKGSSARGEVPKYCGPECRKLLKDAERRAGKFLYTAVRDARLFKHSNPERSNAARSAIAEYMATHFAELDAIRQAMSAGDGVPRITTRQAKSRG